jgi:predicted ATPase/DNA-binding SARP family transcriptional activator
MRKFEGSQSEARLFLLGAPRGHIAGQDIQITHRKPLALLAYLAVTQRPHTRESLATMFWPDSDMSRAHAYLRNALWQLGQSPFGPWLAVDQDMIELSHEVWVDRIEMRTLLAAVQAHRHPGSDLCSECFRTLVQVVDLYQGDFMEGFTLEDCPEFDTWQFFEADVVKQGVSGALRVLTECAARKGDVRAGLTYARRWVELDPLNEPAQCALMMLYAQSGQRTASLRQYDSLLKDLRSSGLQPAAETIELYKRVRSGAIEPVERPTESYAPKPLPVHASEGPQPAPRSRHNLPAETTTFVGRTQELREARELLAREDCRLITLVGAGGIGKTRLALKLGHEVLDAFPDGVFLVPFVALQATDLIVPTIADALGASFFPQDAVTPQEQLLTYLGDKQMLLLLDNVEHLIQADAVDASPSPDISSLLTEILARTASVKMLVTSRERLNLRGEWVMEVRGLAYPEETSDEEQAATAYTAVQLFIETARRTATTFEPSPSELDAITRICALVEGMPLGLELAAAWTRMLSCAEIAEEVATSLDFLTLTLRDLPERHQSLRAVFARSWSLLSTEERRHFRTLAIFRGGFTREAARDIAGAHLPTLSAFIDKSLLHRTSDNRYEILEVLRQFAEEQLGAVPGEAAEVQRRHTAYYLGFVERMEASLKGDLQTASPIGQKQALERIQKDIGNIRLAWQWALAHRAFDEIERAVIGLALYYDIRSRFRQGERMFREAATALEIDSGEPKPRLLGLLLGIRGEFLCRFGHVEEGCALMSRGHALLAPFVAEPAYTATYALLQILTSYIGIGLSYDERRQRLQDSIMRYRDLGDAWGEALGKEVLGELASYPGNWSVAESLLQESLQLRRRTGDEWGAAMSLYMLGINAMSQGRAIEARAYVEESLALREGLADVHGVILCQTLLAAWLASAGDLEMAAVLHKESMYGYEAIGDLSGVASALMALGHVTRAIGDRAQARVYYLSALEKRRTLGTLAGVAGTLLSLGDLATEMGDYGPARAYLDESLSTVTGIAIAKSAGGTSINGLSTEAFRDKVRQSLTTLDARESA